MICGNVHLKKNNNTTDWQVVLPYTNLLSTTILITTMFKLSTFSITTRRTPWLRQNA